MHIPHTPESLLPRSDSKNPAATCRGLTSNGRPCRRAISKSPSPSPRRASSPGAFCWQHQEQATPCASPSPSRRPIIPVKKRSSVDSLVGRLGILEVEEEKEEYTPPKRERVRRKPIPLVDPDTPLQSIEHSPPRPRKQKNGQRKRQKPVGGGLLCCFGTPDDSMLAPRPTRSNQPARKPTAPLPPNKQSKSTHHLKPGHHDPHGRPSLHRDPSSRTGEFLSLIPANASPSLTAQLLAELAKPVSEYDDEGYIYMFWLTPESLPSDAPEETAASLLAPPSTSRGKRRTSEVLNAFSTPTTSKSPGGNSNEPKTMLLKIGRAQNVHRRLNQWNKQCGYNLSLIRYYPYHPTISADGSEQLPRTPRRVPMAHKVERLIHIELAEKRAREEGKCQTCGREHREWFEVEASREGVKRVDEIVRRWVGWGEREGQR